MDKNKKDMMIVAMALVAQNVYELEKLDGICSITTHYEKSGTTAPKVQMLPETFLDYFGDEEYEYTEDEDGTKHMIKWVDIGGKRVLFLALINERTKVRSDGRLV